MMWDDRGLTVFIPVYNEELIIAANVRRLVDFLESRGVLFELIIGSNGSTDRTVEIGRRLSETYPNIQFFHLSKKGVGLAFREGVKRAKYQRIATVDMDLSIDLEFIPLAYQLLTSNDLIIGSKSTGNQERAWIRKAASNVFIGLSRFFLNLPFHDYSIAAKGYRKDLVMEYLPFIDNKTFYVVEIVYHAHKSFRRVTEVPVRCTDGRQSRFNLIHEGVYKFGNLFLLWLRSLLFHR